MISNFSQVTTAIYRGGQPETAEDWQSLWDLGVTQVIKLNLDSEYLDTVPESVELFKCPISTGEQILTEPDLQYVRDAVGFIRPGTFVHCFHGQDRTGLVIGLFRIKEGWSRERAGEEMVSMGFHRILLGLDRAWLDLAPEYATPSATATE